MRCFVVAWLLLGVTLAAGSARAADLSQEEAALLPVMNQPAIQQALAFAAKVEAWRKRANDLKTQLDNLGPDKPVPPEVAALIKALKQEVIAELRRLFPQVRQAVAKIQQLEQRLTQELAQAQAEAAALKQQLDALQAEVEAIVTTLRNPAQFAKSYLEDEILGKYLDKPYTRGDFSFRFRKVDPAQSIFSPQAQIEILIEYQEGIALTARGIYFEYKGSGVPEPRFDKVTVDTNAASVLSGTALKVLGKAGDSIPDLGLPIKLSNITINPFTPGTDKPGALKFDIAIGGLLDFAESFKAEAKGVTLETNGKLSLPGGLRFFDNTVIIPIGTTPLVMQGYGVTIETQTKTITLETYFATAAGGNSTIAMKCTATFRVPLDPKQGILFKGTLVVGGPDGAPLGDVEVKLTRDMVTGKLTIPSQGSPIPKEILNANFNFKLDKEGITADGVAAMFGLVKQSADLALRFDGSGHLRASDKFQIAGVKVEGSLLIEIRDRFRDIELQAALNVDVDLKVMKANAAVAIHAKWPGQIEVAAEVAGIDAVRFTVDSLDDVTPLRIAEELLKHMDDVLQNIARAASRWAEGKMELFAKWDEHWREEIHNQASKYGVDALRTGNPVADQILGDIARDGKAVGGWASSVYKKSGKEASEFVKDPAKSLSKLPSNVGRTIADAPGAIAGALGSIASGGGLSGIFGGKKKEEPSGPSPAEIRAAKLHRQAEERLQAFVAAIPTVHVKKQSGGGPQKAGQRFASSEAALDVRFANGAGVSEGEGNASAGLSVFGSGHKSDIRVGAGAKSERQTSSDVKAAWVEFRPLISDEKSGTKPKGRVFVDPLNDVSGFNATQIARYELQRLVEKYLPEVELEGPRYLEEKYFAVKNGTSETITVWVQAEAEVREGQGKRWVWRPGPPGSAGAERIVLKPGERKVIPRGDAPADDAVVRGRAVRVWAQGESGEKYTAHRHDSLELVAANPQFNGRRVYYGEKLDEYTYEIKPTPGPKDYAQRRVQLKNGTKAPLTVTLRYRTEEDGQARWVALPEFTLAAGETASPRDAEGLQVVASRLALHAIGDERRYVRHEREPLWLVDESPAGRLYRAEKVGTYLYEFKPLGAEVAPREATVTASQAQVRSGNSVLANVPRGQKFKVEDQNGPWLKVRVRVGGQDRVGWIHQDGLQVAGGAQTSPQQARRTATVRTDQAPLQQGSSTIATLRRGEQFGVHEERAGWVRIEVERNGRTLHGWVKTGYLDVR